MSVAPSSVTTMASYNANPHSEGVNLSVRYTNGICTEILLSTPQVKTLLALLVDLQDSVQEAELIQSQFLDGSVYVRIQLGDDVYATINYW